MIGEAADRSPLAPLPEEGSQRLLKQVFDIWLTPEIERRRSTGKLSDYFQVRKAQVVFEMDAPVTVRLNEEVRAIWTVRATRAIAKGESVSVGDFSEIVSVDLTDNDPNAGHITILLHQGTWWITWNTRYNAGRISDSIAAATEFLTAARSAMGRHHFRAFTDNLFSAVELLAKAELFSTSDKQLLHAKTHSFVKGRFNHLTKWDDVQTDFAKLLNQLESMREQAKYGFKPYTLSVHEAHSLVCRAEKMFESVTSRAPRRHESTGGSESEAAKGDDGTGKVRQ
jgi:hypothetical protein